MIEFWLRMAIAVPLIIGVWTLFEKGMLLGWLGDIWHKRLPRMIQKPLYDCPPCMSSVYGSAVWFGFGGGCEPMWIVFCLALCGIMKILAHNLLQ